VSGKRARPRADYDDDPYPTILGIGSLQAVSAPEEEPDAPPAIWLPMHRSGSRLGGWQRHVLTAPRRPMGFRRP
jgi:hypothetical protein